ncbi:MAG: 2-dehydropantoate 2-reductase [Actinomycetota bacterium]|nr:2-dehydropantoate 2-reductase [Actinomycetota bacterium]
MIAVLGPGGVGGFVAAALARGGVPVTVVAREETAALIARDGIAVRSLRLGDFTARPEAATELVEPGGTLLVATKAAGLAGALERIHAEPALVVPLLNGLDHMATLRDRFPGRVAAGAIRIESDRPAPREVVQTSPFLGVDLASEDTALRPALDTLAAALAGAEIPARVLDSEPEVLWRKLVRLNALACTTSAADRLLGEIRDDPEWRAALEDCIREAAAVAAAEGADVPFDSVLRELEDAHPTLGSSMQRDIAAGREPELDQIPGAVLRAGARHGLACPTIARLTLEIAVRAGVEAPAAAREQAPA